MLREIGRISLLVLSVTLLGCGGEDLSRFKEGLVPVKGKVTLDGEPLRNSGVLFIPKSAASIGAKPDTGTRTAMGETDPQGAYTLISPPSGPDVKPEEYPGCLPGEYAVVLLQRGGAGVEVQPGQKAPEGPVQAIPGKYMDPQKSGLKATVSASSGEFNFDLLSK
jgi:hypothetical protein